MSNVLIEELAEREREQWRELDRVRALRDRGFVDWDDPLVVRAREAIDRARHAAARRVRDRPSDANEVLARGLTGSDDRYGRILRESVSWANALHEGAPDGMVRPTNGAALGALREVVREAWDDHTICVRELWGDGGQWALFRGGRIVPGTPARHQAPPLIDALVGSAAGEFEALVMCLEASPS